MLLHFRRNPGGEIKGTFTALVPMKCLHWVPENLTQVKTKLVLKGTMNFGECHII